MNQEWPERGERRAPDSSPLDERPPRDQPPEDQFHRYDDPYDRRPPRRRPEPSMRRSDIPTMFKKKTAGIGEMIGILLITVSQIIFILGPGRDGIRVAAILNFIGFATVCEFMIGAGVVNSEIDKYARLGMVLGGLILLGMTLGIMIFEGYI